MFIYTYLYMYYCIIINMYTYYIIIIVCLNVGSINQYRKRMTEANTYLSYIISISLVFYLL